MNFPSRWSYLIASAMTLVTASAIVADDVFVQEGVVVKPLSKRKQRKLEKKLLRNPGNEVVIEGSPVANPSPDRIANARARRSLRPLFADRFGRRNELNVGPSVRVVPSPLTAGPETILASPRSSKVLGDPLVIPGSVDLGPAPSGLRPPVVSTPSRRSVPTEPKLEAEVLEELPVSSRSLPAPAEEVPPPVVSIPRKKAGASPGADPEPVVTPPSGPAEPAPSVDPGPLPTGPKPPVDPGPVTEPSLELPLTPKPA